MARRSSSHPLAHTLLGASARQASPQSPFLSQNGHASSFAECPLSGVKRTSRGHRGMSYFLLASGSCVTLANAWLCYFNAAGSR